jgi:hypothetical protein
MYNKIVDTAMLENETVHRHLLSVPASLCASFARGVVSQCRKEKESTVHTNVTIFIVQLIAYMTLHVQ